MTGPGDPAERVDALIAAVAPGLRAPAVRRRDAVLVTGPWLSGASAVVAALRERLPGRDFVEADELAPAEAPVAMVFVVSAAAALTASDCALLSAAAARTDAVIGVVSKIDVHRQWPQLLQTARETLAATAPRFSDVPWVGVAAAPQVGEPQLDDLIAELTARLDDPALAGRNRLRTWEFQLRNDIDRWRRHSEASGRRARVALLQQQRDDALRRRRLARSEQTIALRSRMAQAKVQLSYFARKRCGSIRGELQEDAAGMSRQQLPEFEEYVRSRVHTVIVEVDEGAAEQLADVAQELGLAMPPSSDEPLPEVAVAIPALKSRQLENRLMMLLGAGFGLGVALTLSRIFANLAPGLTAAGAAVCAVIGLGVAVWVVNTRGLLRDRALLDRWVGELTATLRSVVEELVALRVVAAEAAFAAELTEQNETAGAEVDREVAVLDRELREHAASGARAVVLRDRELPTLRSALELVVGELGDPPGAPALDESLPAGNDCAI